MISSNEAVRYLFKVATYALEDAHDPEVLAKLEKVNELAGKMYNEHFAGKETRREFGVFIIALIHYFAAQFGPDEEEGGKDVRPESSKSQVV